MILGWIINANFRDISSLSFLYRASFASGGGLGKLAVGNALIENQPTLIAIGWTGLGL
jgi:hypothetical protein